MKGNILDGIEELIDQRYLLHGLIPIFETDKGYDAEELRDKLLRRRIFPFIPYRRIGAAKKAEKIVCQLVTHLTHTWLSPVKFLVLEKPFDLLSK